MRTTLIIPDAVGRRAKLMARHQQKTLSQFVSEAVEARLVREESAVNSGVPPLRLQPKQMGQPTVDISDRNALFGRMEEERQ